MSNNWNEFLEIVADLLKHDSVQALWDIKHHLGLSCYEHSVFVAYTSYCVAKKFDLDCVAAARAGLLHDLYLDSTADDSRVKHYFTHASHALENARRVCELSEKEENIILAHMWPFSGTLPKSREAYIVSMCDKSCATIEGLRIWYRLSIRRRIPAMGV